MKRQPYHMGDGDWKLPPERRRNAPQKVWLRIALGFALGYAAYFFGVLLVYLLAPTGDMRLLVRIAPAAVLTVIGISVALVRKKFGWATGIFLGWFSMSVVLAFAIAAMSAILASMRCNLK